MNNKFKIGIVGVLILGYINWNGLVENESLNVSRIHKTLFEVNVDNENYQHGIKERYNSYMQPFVDIVEEPMFVVTGLTINELKSKCRMPFFRRANRPDHSLFGRSFYLYGLPSFFIYVALLWTLVTRLIDSIVTRSLTWYFLIGIVGWCFTAHGMISSPNGALMFFLATSFVYSVDVLKNRVSIS